jgi:hypothetical protein
LEAMVRQGQQPPPVPSQPQTPEFFTHMTPEQRAAWVASEREFRPVLEYREKQLREQIQAEVRQELGQFRQFVSEASALRSQHPDFAAMEPQLVAMQQQAAQQGQHYTLGQLYVFQKGQQAIQAAQRSPSPRQVQTQARRRAAGQAARPETVAPAGVRVPAPAATPDRIRAMSDDEILDAIAKQTGIARLKIQKRA